MHIGAGDDIKDFRKTYAKPIRLGQSVDASDADIAKVHDLQLYLLYISIKNKLPVLDQEPQEHARSECMRMP